MNQEAAAAGSSAAVSFTDVASNHWAAGYINWAAGLGIVNGMGDGTFAPDAPVTYEQAVKMIVCALGYESLAVKRGGYPTGYMVIASSYGVTDGVAMTPASINATRAGVAQLIYNALEAPLMVENLAAMAYQPAYYIYDGGSSVDGEVRNLLSEYHEIYKVQATVDETYKSNPDLLDVKNDVKYVELTVKNVYGFAPADFLNGRYSDWETSSEMLGKKSGSSGESELLGGEFIANDAAYANYHGLTVYAYIIENEDEELEVVAMVPDNKSADTVEIKAADFQDITDEGSDDTDNEDGVLTYYVDDEEEELDLVAAEDIIVYVNGVAMGAMSTYAAIESEILDSDVATITLQGSKDEYNKIFLTKYGYGIVDAIDLEAAVVELEDAAGYPGDDVLDFTEDVVASYAIYKNGGDLVNVIESGDEDGKKTREVYVTNTVVEGSISEVADRDGEDVYTIDGAEYVAVADTFKAGTTGEFYITIDGRILAAEITKDFVGNYAFILDIAESTSGFSAGYQVKLLTKDNAIATYDLKSSLKVSKVFDGAYDTQTVKVDSGEYTQANLFDEIDALVRAEAIADNPETEDKNEAKTAQEVYEAGMSDLFITYKASGDEISAIDFAVADDEEDFNVEAMDNKVYTESRERLGSYYVTESTVIFAIKTKVVDGKVMADEDLSQVAKTNRLQDTKAYDGFYFAIEDKTADALLVTTDLGFAAAGDALAVVRSISDGLNANGEVAKVLNAWQGDAFVSIALDDNCDDDFEFGDVVQYQTNAAGEVDEILAIFDYSEKELLVDASGDFEYYAGVVTDDEKGVDLTNAEGTVELAWELAENGTNVQIDVARAARNATAAFKGYASHSYIRANIRSDKFTGNAYVLVVKTNDDQGIEDVVAYMYASDDVKGTDVADFIADHFGEEIEA